MKTLLQAFILVTALFLTSSTWAERRGPAVDYGAFCGSPYGFSHGRMDLSHALDALNAFFAKRGLRVETRGRHHRFLRADVYQGQEHVDSIIFDLKTGKMRSVY